MAKYSQKRCVHLDFHTSPDITGIGSEFSKEKFQKALKIGNIESITVFAKCHHGLCYYPTKVGKMHPYLSFDLLGEMIDAAHEIGVKAPIYITAGWSDADAEEHPEWICVNDDGSFKTTFDINKYPDAPRPCGAWKTMCLHDGPYCESIYALTKEICDRYSNIDGLFYDILEASTECHCAFCKKEMSKLGFDDGNKEDIAKYHQMKIAAFQQKCADILYEKHPDATIFFNSGGADPAHKYNHPYQTHYEMEDLPTAWGGYDKLPLRARLFQMQDKNIVGMTGKFHLDWGEFGGYKLKEALRYEAVIMAMYGVGISVGDHLHPDGEPDNETYKNIGYAFDYFEKIEPYCFGGINCADIGIYGTVDGRASNGLVKALCEAQLDFRCVDDGNFEKCGLVVFPGKCELDAEKLAKLKAYISGGGKVVFMYDALVENGRFLIDVGAEYLGDAEYDVDYICNRSLEYDGEELPEAPMLCQFAGKRIKAVDCEILAESQDPYFKRTYAHFCGHKNTPNNKGGETRPSVIKKGNVVYIANPISAIYHEYGAVFQKRYLLAAIKSVYKKPLVEVFTDDNKHIAKCRAILIKQPEQKRYCLNIAYASPVKSGCAEIIEDIVPLCDLNINVNINEKTESVCTLISGESLCSENTETGIRFTLPKLNMHETIILKY